MPPTLTRGALPLAAQLTVRYTQGDTHTPRSRHVVDAVLDFTPGACPDPGTAAYTTAQASPPMPSRHSSLPELQSAAAVAAARRDFERLFQCASRPEGHCVQGQFAQGQFAQGQFALGQNVPGQFALGHVPPRRPGLVHRLSEPTLPSRAPSTSATYNGVDLSDGCACDRHHHRRDSVAVRFARTRYARV